MQRVGVVECRPLNTIFQGLCLWFIWTVMTTGIPSDSPLSNFPVCVCVCVCVSWIRGLLPVDCWGALDCCLRQCTGNGTSLILTVSSA